MMQHSVANYVNINDYDYDKQIKQKNKDIAAIQAQINALTGVTGDSVKARRAKLQAELQEKQEDLEDTRFDHLIDTQQQGFDQLSKDMQEALDNAIELINGNQKVLQEVANTMLQQLVTNGVDEAVLLNNLRESHGTIIDDSTQQIINALSSGNVDVSDKVNTVITESKQQIIDSLILGTNGIKDMVKNATSDMSTVIANAIPSDQISALVAHLPVEDEKLKNIENAIRSKAAEDKAKQQADANLKAATDVINLIKQIGTVGYNDVSKAKIDKAQTAFNKLTDAQKALVSNKGVLEAANATYNKEKQKAENLKKQKDNLNTQITNQNKKIKDLEAKMNIAYSNANDAAQVRKNFESQLKAIEERIKVAKRSTALQSAVPALQNHKNEIIKSINDYSVRYDTYRKQYNDYKKQLEAEKANLQKLQTQLKSLATGTKRFGKNGLAWTNENLKNGSELIIRPSDGAILTPLKANDAVIPANLANNLFKWGAINPDSFAVNPFMGKWENTSGRSSNSDMFSNNTTNQSVEMHFDSLITVQGNVDADVVSRLEDLSKSLTSNKDFQKNVIKFVTKDFVKESRKLGLR